VAFAPSFICSICCFVHKVKTRRREGILVISYININISIWKLPKGSRLNSVRHLLVIIRKIQFPAGAGIFSFCHHIQPSSKAKDFYRMDYDGIFSLCKSAGAWSWLPLNIQVFRYVMGYRLVNRYSDSEDRISFIFGVKHLSVCRYSPIGEPGWRIRCKD
jgi:hypothetical protein